jgi:hypothetical protein
MVTIRGAELHVHADRGASWPSADLDEIAKLVNDP